MEALIDDFEEDDNCLDDEVSRNWGEILTHCYAFDRLEKQVYFLKRVSKTKACRWLEMYTHPGNDYRKLSIKVHMLDLRDVFRSAYLHVFSMNYCYDHFK